MTTTKTLKEIKEELRTTDPNICLQVFAKRDPYERWDDPINKDWTEGLDPGEWQCWQHEVRATAVVNGEMVTASAHLGGTWEKYGDNPLESNPEISGYLPQMVEEALDDLRCQI